MGYVFYDTETTGLNPAFDQITQFAAVHASDRLEVTGRVNVKARLQPHILPSPKALCITRCSIDELLSAERTSFFEMMRALRTTLLGWSPSTFIGYNSIRFDEAFLRFGFYHTLHPAYLTSRHNNSRGDALSLVRAVHALQPSILKAPLSETGKKSFKLRNICTENGFYPERSHEAAADVESTMWLCKLVAERAPQIWSYFLRFTNRNAVDQFLRTEEVSILVDPRHENSPLRPITWLGQSEKDNNRHYCLELTDNIKDYLNFSDEELLALVTAKGSPVRRIRINASPLLLPIYETDDFESLDAEPVLVDRADAVRSTPHFLERLLRAINSTEKVYSTSPHVDDQLYEKFADWSEERTMSDFHASDWVGRLQMLNNFSDERFRRLGLRVIFFENPDILDANMRDRITSAIRDRHTSDDATSPWMTVGKARDQIQSILSNSAEHQDVLENYRSYLGRVFD